MLLGGDSAAAITTPLDSGSPVVLELGATSAAGGSIRSPAAPQESCCPLVRLSRCHRGVSHGPWGGSAADPALAVPVQRQHLALKELTFHQHLS